MSATPFTPELGQAAFGAPWQELEMPEYVRRGLATLGAAVTSESSSGGDPTDNSGASFENEVFVLNAYCWCDGENLEHEEGCPPNFEYKPSGFVASWYKYLGRGSSVSEAIDQDAFTSLLAACLASLSSGGVRVARQALADAARAVLPADSFVETSIEGERAWLRVTLPWPVEVPAAPDPDPSALVAPVVAVAEVALAAALAGAGWTLEPASDEPFHLACPFPPSGDGSPEDVLAATCYRELSDDELRAAGWEDPGEASWLDRAELVAYSAINLFRQARRRLD